MNGILAAQEAVIISHENSRKRMQTKSYNAFFNSVTPASPKDALPVITFPKNMSLHANGEDIQLIYVNPAHSDGDAIVWFPEANVVHLGDIYIGELYPIIDVANGGDVNGYAPAIDHVLRLIDEETAVVPGHGPVGYKADLIAYRNMIATIRDRVKTMLDDGKDIDEILDARPTAAFDEIWASNRVNPDHMTMMVYQSLSGDYLKMKADSE